MKLRKFATSEEFVMKMFGDYNLEALQKECKRRKTTLDCLLWNFILSYCDDEFADYCYELCEKHHIEIPYEDEAF